KPASVHLTEFPQADAQWDDADRDARWEILLEARQTVLFTLEGLRKNKTIGSAQEAVVTISGSPDLPVLSANLELLTTLCMVSEILIEPNAEHGGTGLRADADKSPYAKCE